MTFKIDTPTSICFSGGRTSGKMLYEIIAAFDGTLPQDVHVIFENTGKEREETLVFINEVAIRWDINVVWLEYDDVFDAAKYNKAGRRKPFGVGDLGFRVVDFNTASRNAEPFDKLLRYYAEYRKVIKGIEPILPTVPSRICTTHLKIKTNTRYMHSIGYADFNAALGIRFDEPKRWASMIAQNNQGNERYYNVMPLYDARVVKQDVKDFWQAQPFDLGLDPESYAGNCDFCFLKNTDKVINLMRLRLKETNGVVPPDIQWWVDKEEAAGTTFRLDRTYKTLVYIAQSGMTIAPSTEPVIDCICGEAND